jgi:hypothetical protein
VRHTNTAFSLLDPELALIVLRSVLDAQIPPTDLTRSHAEVRSWRRTPKLTWSTAIAGPPDCDMPVGLVISVVNQRRLVMSRGHCRETLERLDKPFGRAGPPQMSNQETGLAIDRRQRFFARRPPNYQWHGPNQAPQGVGVQKS